MIRTRGLYHIQLIVRALERSLRFYQGVLGLEEQFRDGERLVFLSTPGGQDLVTLNEDAAEAEHAGEGGGIAHFGFELVGETDLDAAIAALEGEGGRLLRRGEHGPGTPFAYVADPDGYEIEL